MSPVIAILVSPFLHLIEDAPIRAKPSRSLRCSGCLRPRCLVCVFVSGFVVSPLEYGLLARSRTSFVSTPPADPRHRVRAYRRMCGMSPLGGPRRLQSYSPSPAAHAETSASPDGAAPTPLTATAVLGGYTAGPARPRHPARAAARRGQTRPAGQRRRPAPGAVADGIRPARNLVEVEGPPVWRRSSGHRYTNRGHRPDDRHAAPAGGGHAPRERQELARLMDVAGGPGVLTFYWTNSSAGTPRPRAAVRSATSRSTRPGPRATSAWYSRRSTSPTGRAGCRSS